MIFQALGTGYRRVRSNLRLVVLAWAVNAAMALLLAVPFLNQLDSYVSPTVKEEQLLFRLDENWYRTYQFDMRANPLARLLDYSTLGAAPFIHHLDGVLSGRSMRALGGFVWNAIVGLRLQTGSLDLLALLAFAYSLVGVFFSAGLINAYAGGRHVSLAEFTSGAARYFGRFFRVSLIGFLVMYLLLVVANRWVGGVIWTSTQNDASEGTAFVLQLGKNAVLILLLWFLSLILDYAKVRMVLEGRKSAIDAVGAGALFVVRHLRPVIQLSLTFIVLTLVLMGVYAAIVTVIPQTTYAMIALLVLVQQVIVAGRMGLKAGTYASEVALLRLAYPAEHGERFMS